MDYNIHDHLILFGRRTNKPMPVTILRFVSGVSTHQRENFAVTTKHF